jgi:hypothetical protein
VSSLRCRAVLLLVLVLYLGACTTWRVSTVGPRQAIEAQPDRVRVTLLDSTTVVVDRPVVVNDSVATVSLACQEESPGQRTCMMMPTTVLPLSEVVALELRRYQLGRTLFMLGPLAVLVFLLTTRPLVG